MNSKANFSGFFPSENIFRHFNNKIQQIFTSVKTNDKIPISFVRTGTDFPYF